MSDDSLDRDPFERIAESFLARYRAGERPSIAEYAARHPELADQIRRLLPALVLVEQDLSVDGDLDEVRRDWEAIAGRSRRLGDYRILGEIGRGGMGVVYEAEQVSLGRRVALKVLPHQVAHDPKALERFRREAKAAARLHHTNIVPVFEVGRDGETAYYAMQFIQGRGLDQVIEELARLRGRGRDGAAAAPGRITAAETGAEGLAPGRVAGLLLTGQLADEAAVRLSGAGPAQDSCSARAPAAADPDGLVRAAADVPMTSAAPPGRSEMATTALSGRGRPFFRSVAQIGRQVAQGLAYAHSRGVIHRDIKPSNLLLDHAGVVWITDFGLARADDERLTQSGDLLGTLRYMAPERFRGGGDARVDIYSLGLTLYEMLTLRPAFETADRLEMMERIKTEEPARPRSCDGCIPRDLETIVLKAIDKDPAQRYLTAGAMAEDLRRFLGDESILARRASTAERSWRWARRNQGIAVLGGVLTVVLVLATIGSLLTARRFARLAEDRGIAADQERSLRQEADRARNEARRQEGAAIVARNAADARGRAERWERYRSNIAEASAAAQLQDSTTGEQALERAPEEHRNWEWRHLHGLLDGASLVLPVTGIVPHTLRLSPDGRQIAVGDRGGEVHLFDAATGRPGPVLRGHAGRMASLEYSPDGRQLASGAEDRTIRIWDPATGRQHLLLRGEGTPYFRYRSDGKRIASYEALIEADRATYRLWDATTGRPLAILGERPHPGIKSELFCVPPMAFSPDGMRLVVATGEAIRVYDAATGRPLSVLRPVGSTVDRILFSPDGRRLVVTNSWGTIPSYLLDGDSGEVVAVVSDRNKGALEVAFSADGSRLATSDAYPANEVRLWEPSSGKLVRTWSGHAPGGVDYLRFSPDGRRLASATGDLTGRLWDGQTGQQIAVLRGHTGNPTGRPAFSPDGTRLATASEDRTLRLWEAGGGDLIAVLRGHRGIVWPPAFTPDSSRLVSPSYDGTVRVWDMKMAERNGVLRGHTSFVYDVAFRPDGMQVASAAWDGTVRLWDPDKGQQTGLLRDAGQTTDSQIMSAVAYDPDGRRLATANRGLGVTLWDAGVDARRRSWPGALGGWYGDGRVAFSPDGAVVAAGTTAGPVRLWHAATGELVAEFAGHEGVPRDVAFAPEGATLASAGLDGTVRLWDVVNRKAVAVLRGHTAAVNRIAFSADGGLLASGSNDTTVRLWNTRTREAIASMNIGSKVYGVAFSPNGTRLALGCADTMIRLIDVATRQEVVALRGHADYVHAVAWSPDGTRLVSGSGDHTVRVWDSLSVQARARASRGDPSHPGGPSRPH